MCWCQIACRNSYDRGTHPRPSNYWSTLVPPQSKQMMLNIFIADEHRESRRIIRESLQSLKNVEYTEFAEAASLKSDLEFLWPDLIILDFSLPGDVHKTIRGLRHNEFGMNPFVPVIAMTREKKQGSLERIIDCGVDVVLLKPLNSATMINCINKLSTDRKQFVVTSNYIGPDRRTDSSRPGIPLIDPPNTLKLKRSGQDLNVVKLHSWVRQELDAVNEVRLRSNTMEISRLADLVLPDYEQGKVTRRTFSHLASMTDITTDLSSRIQVGEFDHIEDFCENLNGLIHAIVEKRENPLKKDLQLIKPLCEAILAGIDAEGEDLKRAMEISSSIANTTAHA